MIGVEEARGLVRQNTTGGSKETVPVVHAIGRRLYTNVRSPVNLPLFNQSAMDGYAVSSSPLKREGGQLLYRIIGEVKAGDAPLRSLQAGTAVRIFTGAAVPSGAGAVVMQEVTTVSGEQVSFGESDFIPGSNIRISGNQVSKGELALEAGRLLNPASIGFLHSMGVESVTVWRKPITSVMGTGDELVPAGNRRKPGKIFESNTGMVAAALRGQGFPCSSAVRVKDKLPAVVNALKKLLAGSDVVIVCGGISGGKYDLVREALKSLKVQEIFYKVSQKPGKPMYFGRKGSKIVFALPGNPAAVLVGVYVYVLPALKHMSGDPGPEPETAQATLLEPFHLKSDRDLFLRAIAAEAGVRITEGQDSDNLRSFSSANCLVYLKAGEAMLSGGTAVNIFKLPPYFL
jgi:molybdopterin molybdotransferase